MSKFTVKTKLSNIKKEDGQFTYKEEIVFMKWDAKAQRDAVQSGKGPGEFGPDYSDRKKFHLDYHADWEHPTHDTMGKPLQSGWPSDGEDDEPMKKHYEPYVIEPFIVPDKDHEGYEYTTDEDRVALVYQEKKGKYE
jgi:hypothetical protein